MNWARKYQWLFLCLAIVLLKVLIIDIDLPDWELGYYQPIDEFYYASLAYNLYDYQALFYNDMLNPHLFGCPILTNLLAYFSLSIFGDTYLGLRASSIGFSIISVLFVWLFLKKAITNNIVRHASLLFLVLNFSFTLSSITVEPTISRIMAMLATLTFIIYYYEKIINKNALLFTAGSIVTLLVFITYPSNVFIILASYLALVIYPFSGKFKDLFGKEIIVKSFIFSGGVIVGLGIYLIVINLAENRFVLDSISDSGGVYTGRVGLTLRAVISNIIKMGFANIFKLNPLLLLVSVICIYGLVSKSPKALKREIVIVLFFLLSLLLQTTVLNDYAERKLIIFLPLIVIILAYRADLLIGNKTISSISTKRFIILSVLSLCTLLYAYKFYEFNRTMAFSIIALFLALVIYIQFMKKKFANGALIVITILLLIPEILNSTDQLVVNRTYEYKKTFKKLKKYDGKNFLGGLTFGFRAYNDTRPMLNRYANLSNLDSYWQQLDSLSRNGQQDYSIFYKEGEFESEYKKMGFVASEILMKAENTIYTKDIWLYKESPVK